MVNRPVDGLELTTDAKREECQVSHLAIRHGNARYPLQVQLSSPPKANRIFGDWEPHQELSLSAMSAANAPPRWDQACTSQQKARAVLSGSCVAGE